VGNRIRISAKNLGAAALPEFCPRCSWLKLHLKFDLPYQIFAGIFSSIDSYTKRGVHRWIDNHKEPPDWLKSLGDVAGYVEPPHYSKFTMIDKEFDIELRGTPDGMLVLADRSHVIVDYKTAKYTGTQDELFPMYEAQLNAYEMIADALRYPPVSELALVYFEPTTTDAIVQNGNVYRVDGFVMPFTAHIVPVRKNREIVRRLMAKTRELYDQPACPVGRGGCEKCVPISAGSHNLDLSFATRNNWARLASEEFRGPVMVSRSALKFPKERRLIPLHEVAAFLSVSAGTLRRWTNRGVLRCYRIGPGRERRFLWADIEAYLRKNEDAGKVGRPRNRLSRPWKRTRFESNEVDSGDTEWQSAADQPSSRTLRTAVTVACDNAFERPPKVCGGPR
jgi:excisionase family DNA binding protein